MIIYRPDGTQLMEIAVDDESYRFQEMMGKDELVLKFSLAEHTEIPVGSYCFYPEQAGGAKYTLLMPTDVTIVHRKCFEYTVTVEGVSGNLRKHRLYNPVDGRLKFDYTAQPQEHIDLLVRNLVDRYGAGSWVDDGGFTATEKLISYNHSTLADALNAIAEAFNTEWEIYVSAGVNHIRLGKIEHGADNPLPLSYGKGNGFISGVSRTNYDDNLPVGRIYIEGGDRNIDYSKYPDTDPDGQHSRTLLLPRSMNFSFDGEKFNDEYGYDASNAVAMCTDARGYSLSLSSAPQDTNEDSIDLTQFYPSRVGRITSVLFWHRRLATYVEKEDITDWSYIEIDVVDNKIASTLNYSSCLMAGETMTMVFQSGMLAGRELGVKYHHEAVGSKPARRFEIVKEDFDGQTMPSEYFLPVAGNGTTSGDEYAIFGIMLPDAYIMSKTADTSHRGKYVYSGACYDMLREAAKYIYKNKNSKYTFKGVLDGIYAKRNWANISSRIAVGGCIRFTDASVVGPEQHYDLRIASVKDYINNPHSPTIELTDEEVYSQGGGLSSELQQLNGDIVHAEAQHRQSIAFAKRGFKDAEETSEMLANAFSDALGSPANPVTIRTMQLLAGDESLQYRFWQNANCTGLISTPVMVNTGSATLVCSAAYLQHLTLNVKDATNLTAARDYTSYHRWHIDAQTFQFSALDPELAYYLYAQCTIETADDYDTVASAQYILQPSPSDDDTHTMLLVGILNSEHDGLRSYTSVYGYTEILPSQITTSKVVNADGTSYFDLEQGSFDLGGKLQYNTDGGGNLVLRGSLVQSGNGTNVPITAYCGSYNATRTYQKGDEVIYTVDGVTSTYKYIYATASAGHAPTDTTYWEVSAAGVKGEAGSNGPSLTYRGVYDRSKKYFGTTQRCDVVKWHNPLEYTDLYYIANPNSVEQWEGFSGFNPTDTDHWIQFGASFESIATGVLFAEEAYIDNAIVRKLKTNDSGAYLDIHDTSITAVDDSGKPMFVLNTDTISDSGTDTDYETRGATAFVGSYSATELKEGIYNTVNQTVNIRVASTTATLTTFTVASDNTVVSVPSANLNITISRAAGASGYAYADVGLKMVLVSSNGTEYGLSVLSRYIDLLTNPTSDTEQFPAFSVSLNAGTYSLKVIGTVSLGARSDFSSSSNTQLSLTVGNGSGTMTVRYGSECTFIGANGFRAKFSGNQIAEFTKGTDGKITMMMRNGSYGVRVVQPSQSSQGLQFLIGGTWYYASYGSSRMNLTRATTQ